MARLLHLNRLLKDMEDTMSNDRPTRRTVLPPGDAEGAGNFAAEPGMDPTAGPPDDGPGPAMLQELGMPTVSNPLSPAGEEGNATGGDPTEVIRARRADSAAAGEAILDEMDENQSSQQADV